MRLADLLTRDLLSCVSQSCWALYIFLSDYFDWLKALVRVAFRRAMRRHLKQFLSCESIVWLFQHLDVYVIITNIFLNLKF